MSAESVFNSMPIRCGSYCHPGENWHTFYWENDAIVMVDGAKQIKIGQYRSGDYGIAVSTDGGDTWSTAIDFDGLHGGGGETIIYQDTITKAGLAPNNPSANDLWVDTIENRLKLWNGTEWVNIGYEPTEPDPTDPDTPGGDNPDDPGGEGTEPENPGGDDPVDPGDGGEDNPEDPVPGHGDPGGDDSGGGTVTGGNEENPEGEEPSEEGGGS